MKDKGEKEEEEEEEEEKERKGREEGGGERRVRGGGRGKGGEVEGVGTWKATCEVNMSLSFSKSPLLVYMKTE